ncbi:hypothetical protein Nepgr_008187 [Nepenthes gracilis]|uniref:Phytosulfokine n=1 Tax=Nepenthes gracilis TaxID=150966 RepID=A0AAD3S932_NEPGR|nr:hypothetical protein Nepgr_008187 [Nepenthes gracilis]
MSKFAALIMIFLLLRSTLTFAGRPEPTFPRTSLLKSRHGGFEDGDVELQVDNDEGCNEGISEEECLLRRTLVAHTDYIYTQNLNP